MPAPLPPAEPEPESTYDEINQEHPEPQPPSTPVQKAPTTLDRTVVPIVPSSPLPPKGPSVTPLPPQQLPVAHNPYEGASGVPAAVVAEPEQSRDYVDDSNAVDSGNSLNCEDAELKEM